jgi:hypothetical protein
MVREQVKLFCITYTGYVIIHLFREFWAMSKKSMIMQAEENDMLDKSTTFSIDKETLSVFDTI